MMVLERTVMFFPGAPPNPSLVRNMFLLTVLMRAERTGLKPGTGEPGF